VRGERGEGRGKRGEGRGERGEVGPELGREVERRKAEPFGMLGRRRE
jgi:hypothetical protein